MGGGIELRGVYSKACLTNLGQSEKEPVIMRLWMKSNLLAKVHSCSKSSISNMRFGGIL